MLETEDMQGLLLSAYGEKHPSAAFVFFSIADPAKAKAWLKDVAPLVIPGKNFDKNRDSSLHIAITHKGFARLGLSAATLATFSRPFVEDMAHPVRASLLGDESQNWQWGRPDHNIHVLLMLYANDQPTLTARLATERDRAQGALEYLFHIPCQDLPERPGHLKSEEHFGFRDGLSQPTIAEHNPKHPHNDVKAGEFILGYENEYGKKTASPLIKDPDTDPAKILARGDLGRNGTYLVLRQLEQDVPGFWNMLAQKSSDPETQDALAAKIVGRRRDGTLLIDEKLSSSDFSFDADPHGYGCPLGAHIRRANPRDTLLKNPAESIATGKRHRLLRRGRTYGPPIQDRYTPDGESRGLVFVTLNANIERQFEFVQHAWITSPNFAGLHDEGDPLLGGRPEFPGAMTLPGRPVRQRCAGLLPHITVKGGGYFFLPSLSALRYLASV